MDTIQEKKGSSLREVIVEMKDGRKEGTVSQDATEANPEKMEPNPGEKEAIAERQENPNEEVALHSLRACREQENGLPSGDGGQSREDGAN
jgi:hypothetical protein